MKTQRTEERSSITNIALASLLISILGIAASNAHSFPLSFVDSFSTADTLGDGPEGITFDPYTGNLLLVSSSGITPGIDDSRVISVTTSGVAAGALQSIGLSSIEGINGVGPDSFVISNSTSSSEGGLYTYSYAANTFGSQIITNPPSGDSDGVTFHSGTGSYWVADDSDERIYEFDGSGNELSSILTTGIDSAFDEPEGIDYDPVSGRLFIVDDSTGTGDLFEISTDGTLLDQHDLQAMPGLAGLTDPEGVAFDPFSDRLYIAFDNEQTVGIFQIERSIQVPEPSSIALILLGCAALFCRRYYA